MNNLEHEKSSWFSRFHQRIKSANTSLISGLKTVFAQKKIISTATLESIETLLIRSNCGYAATQKLLKALEKTLSSNEAINLDIVHQNLSNQACALLTPLEKPFLLEEADLTLGRAPHLIMMSGVNGSGKTTSIGKLAALFAAQNRSVLIASGDTFRAAANQQLSTWAQQAKVSLLETQGGDPSSVIYDALHSAQAKKIDIVLADTAGRLSTQKNLMNELSKIHRVIKKIRGDIPYERWLVIDASSGQNAVSQVNAFHSISPLTGLILTKLDGTGKGGVLLAIAEQCPVPIRYVTFGESIDDIAPFNARAFSDSLFQE